MEFISGTFLWVLTIFLGVVFTIIAQDPIQWFLARIFGRFIPRRPRGVKGLWRATYEYMDYGEKETEDQIIELRQFGNRVVGRNLTGSMHWYQIQGTVQLQIYFTGLWNNISDGDIFHGTFQIVIEPEGNVMKGKWLGFNRDQEIQHGPWKWTLLTRDLSRTSLSMQLRRHLEQNEGTMEAGGAV